MNQQLQDTANKALEQMVNLSIQGINGAIEFSKQQIPDVIHQMLVWNAVSSGIRFAIGVGFIVGFVLYFKFLVRYVKDGKWSRVNESTKFSFTMLSGIVLGSTLLLGVMGCLHSLDWLQIILAPKYYLLQQAASLVQGG